MGSVVSFCNEKPEHEIKPQRSDRFFEIANDLSAFIESLPLNQSDNDKLIHLVTDNIKEAEHTAFLCGFDLGIKVAKDSSAAFHQ